jgi:hypothetical protein
MTTTMTTIMIIDRDTEDFLVPCLTTSLLAKIQKSFNHLRGN